MKYLLTMSDGSVWSVPVGIIATSRAEFYKIEFDGDLQASLDEDTCPLFNEHDFEIEDWAKNNMNWSDVKDHAERIKGPEIDFDDEWCNGEVEIV